MASQPPVAPERACVSKVYVNQRLWRCVLWRVGAPRSLGTQFLTRRVTSVANHEPGRMMPAGRRCLNTESASVDS